MNNSLRQHGPEEVYKQLHLSMKRNHLESIKVEVFRRAGKIQVKFTGAPDQVMKAEGILARWA
jgi:hypothetical protein